MKENARLLHATYYNWWFIESVNNNTFDIPSALYSFYASLFRNLSEIAVEGLSRSDGTSLMAAHTISRHSRSNFEFVRDFHFHPMNWAILILTLVKSATFTRVKVKLQRHRATIPFGWINAYNKTTTYTFICD